MRSLQETPRRWRWQPRHWRLPRASHSRPAGMGARIGRSAPPSTTTASGRPGPPGAGDHRHCRPRQRHRLQAVRRLPVEPEFRHRGGLVRPGRDGIHRHHGAAGNTDRRRQLRGLNLDLVGTLPLTDRFSLSAGWASRRQGPKATSAPPAPLAFRMLDANPSQRSTNAKFGLGVMYKVTDSLAMPTGSGTLRDQGHGRQQGSCRHGLGRPGLLVRRHVTRSHGRCTGSRRCRRQSSSRPRRHQPR